MPEFSSHIGLLRHPGGSDGKVSVYNAGDPGLIPGSGRSPGERNTGTYSHTLYWLSLSSEIKCNFIFPFFKSVISIAYITSVIRKAMTQSLSFSMTEGLRARGLEWSFVGWLGPKFTHILTNGTNFSQEPLEVHRPSQQTGRQGNAWHW